MEPLYPAHVGFCACLILEFSPLTDWVIRETWGTIQKSTSSQPFLREAHMSRSGMGRNVHSLMSIQHFFCWPWYHPPPNMPWRMVLDRHHGLWHFRINFPNYGVQCQAGQERTHTHIYTYTHRFCLCLCLSLSFSLQSGTRLKNKLEDRHLADWYLENWHVAKRRTRDLSRQKLVIKPVEWVHCMKPPFPLLFTACLIFSIPMIVALLMCSSILVILHACVGGVTMSQLLSGLGRLVCHCSNNFPRLLPRLQLPQVYQGNGIVTIRRFSDSTASHQ